MIKLPIITRREFERLQYETGEALTYGEQRLSYLERENRMAATTSIMLSIALCVVAWDPYKLRKSK